MTLREYAEHVAKRARVVWIDDAPWVSKNRVLRPLTMPHRMRPARTEHVRAGMRKSGAVLAQWSQGWDLEPGDWWYVCCDRKDYDIQILRKPVRYDVRRGLQECEIRTVEGEWFAENGFPVYAAAFQHYGSSPPLTAAEFAIEFRRHATYSGRQTWGAFIGETLVAWTSCVVVDDAVIMSSAKSDPTYFKSRPNNALLYVLTRHYLREKRLEYVLAGARALIHETNVQEFDKKMGYREIYCHLRLELNPLLRFANALRIPTWARRIGLGGLLKEPLDKLGAVAELVRISSGSVDATVTLDQGAAR